MRSQTFYTIAFIGAIVFISIDRLLKSIAIAVWTLNPQPVFSWLSLTLAKNTSIAFSLSTFINPLFLIIPIVLIVLIVLVKSIQDKTLNKTAVLILILLGASSNLYDRLYYGYIIDYISIRYFTVFNLADVMICVGIILLLKGLTKTNKMLE